MVLSEAAPPRLSSVYAEEGTKAHAIGEAALLAGLDAVNDTEFGEAVNVYLGEVWSVYTPSSHLCVEEKFVLDVPAAMYGEVFGANDAAVFNPDTGRLTVFDYKHGKGVGVSAYENKQLMFYAAGAVSSHPEWDVTSIELVIVQPRGPSPDPVSRWEMPLWQLIDYPAQINAAIVDALSDNPTFAPGDHCRWCPASEICDVREKRFMEAAQLDFTGVAEITAVAKLPELDLAYAAKVLDGFNHLSAWVQSIRERVEARMLAGETVPGMKVVERVGRRKWSADDEEVVGYLTMMHDLDKNEIYPRKLVTITEAEKQLKSKLGAKEFAPVKEEITMKFMVKESSGYACVPESDRRLAVTPVQAEFGSVNIDSLFDGE